MRSSFSCPPDNKRAHVSRASRWEMRVGVLTPERVHFPRASSWFHRFHGADERSKAMKPPFTRVRHNRQEGTKREGARAVWPLLGERLFFTAHRSGPDGVLTRPTLHDGESKRRDAPRKKLSKPNEATRDRASRGDFFCPGRQSDLGHRGEMRRGGGCPKVRRMTERPRRRAGCVSFI